MSQTEKLAALRHKVVCRRRTLIESLQKVAEQHLTRDSLARIQAGIDAVERAIEDETRAESTTQAPPRTSTISGEK
jgi:hypothetical protein